MSLFDELLQPETLASVKAKIIGYAQAAGLSITNWIVGSVGEQMFQAFAAGMFVTSAIITKAVRGFSGLDTSTDPGDPDDVFTDNESLTAEPGFLSHYGENTFGTIRGAATFANGTVLLENNGSIARTFSPGGLVFTWTGGTPPVPAPTYRNSADDTVYTNPDGSVTVPAGDDLELPVEAEEIGTRSNAPPGVLSLTTTMVGCTATNADPIVGTDREDAALYRARCRQASSRVSLSGPVPAYEYFASKNLDGTALLNADGDEVAITRVQVTQDSDTGIVNAYYADPSGAPSAADVTAANTNIETEVIAVPDAITFTGAAATEVNITVEGDARIVGGPGITSAIVKQAIVDAVVAVFETFPVGGKDQDASGNGVIHTSDIQAAAAAAYPGLYNVVVSLPGADTTALSFGEVATVTTNAAGWTLVIV